MSNRLFKNGIDLFNELSVFINGADNLSIYVPYIKLQPLKALIDNHSSVKTVVVRWEPRDLITGASDLEIYSYLKEKGITLYRNPRVHLKAFVHDGERAFFGSANISQRALNNPPLLNYNYELATVVENLGLDERLYFNLIEAESVLITDLIYEQIKSQLPEKIASFPKESDFDIAIQYPDKNYSISSLPMTYNVETLYRIYETHEGLHEVELSCSLHDLALYNLPLGLPLDEFKKQLKVSFFNHPFIREFLRNVDNEGEIYFGGAKDWIHRNCSDVPTPRKWEITENIQILYRWITALGEGIYQMDRPSHSERLFLIK
ncbi:MAG: hypothetical protein JWQ63_1492 [Mucilaginibacter sp.]|nr:hypothetical protein [Mucilaginibacter sp.]